ncbi:UBAP1-MVB12-associated (UMA)-domain containing protein 1 isoform X2 [Balearica regulorum gibbericeps]|uniref:UBAP1-MVB12-associated (UMA)-domain containing protein 1 isoform X2 n=1 Tax=Balearica regulorum gibbericeps TaxID=100784 RepID=UPI003F60E329
MRRRGTSWTSPISEQFPAFCRWEGRRYPWQREEGGEKHRGGTSPSPDAIRKRSRRLVSGGGGGIRRLGRYRLRRKKRLCSASSEKVKIQRKLQCQREKQMDLLLWVTQLMIKVESQRIRLRFRRQDRCTTSLHR